MDPLFCDMRPTGQMHVTIPQLQLFRCSRDDCRKNFWSYGPNIRIRCRHKRGGIETLVAATKQVFRPGNTTKKRRSPQKSKKQMPPLTTQLKNFAAASAAYVADPTHVSQEEYDARLKICEPCPFRQDDRCTQCGCHLRAKAVAKAWRCPLFKWPGDLDMNALGIGILLQHESEKQPLVELIQSYKNASPLTILDCIGDYVPFHNEQVRPAANWRQAMIEFRTYRRDAHSYLFLRPHVRGSQIFTGMHWVQQFAAAGMVSPAYADTRRKLTHNQAKAGPKHWRPVPSISPDAFLITKEVFAALGTPDMGDDLYWALQFYSLRARLAGFVVAEAWNCSQVQNIPQRPPLPQAVQDRAAATFGPYWYMLLSDARTKSPTVLQELTAGG